MNVNSALYEIESINKELKRLRAKSRELNQRKKTLLAQTIDAMRETGESSVVYQGKTYKLEEQTRRGRKGEKQKHFDTVQLLNEQGFDGDDAEQMYSKLRDVSLGPESVSYKLT